MTVCVIGITALQLYYSYVNYTVAEGIFKRDADEAFLDARDSTMALNRRRLEKEFRGWLQDTTYVNITCHWDAQKEETVFKMKHLKPIEKLGGAHEMSMSISTLNQRFDSITPQAKKLFINHIMKSVSDGLSRGTVWYFTQELGDRLSKAYNKTPIDTVVLRQQYHMALSHKNITLPFVLTEKKPGLGYDHTTFGVNIGTDGERYIWAGFTNTGVFLLDRLKWVIAGSLLLIGITLFCFWYALKTLLSQQKLNALKDDFINNMTHEIHTPLAGITVTAQALKQFSHSPEEQQNYLDIILYQADKLNALTDEILAGARLGVDNEEKESVGIDGFLQDVVQGVGQAARVNVEAMPNITVSIYKNHLGRAVANLFDNALKYSEEQVVLSCKVEKSTLCISVTDNGSGIPDGFKNKVFDTFYRIPTGNVHNIKGYGLGLSYVKKVATMHGGSVSVSDNTPHGAIFTLLLPL
ncbi:hypothetical protein AM493_17695 [Flavobacterium akiainvivens]|uniref:histidine kinase n=2 Tax=Flavobacterium akiainvivens TaxID=1202724 RepID=A0A0N0RR14_9FLAO|nr:hypothetical protein AM493_17695 [Flavobacterium akiainvivens]